MHHTSPAPLTRLKQKGQITLPKRVRDRLGLSEGDFLEIDVEGGRGSIMPRRVVSAAPSPGLSAKEQQALLRAQKKIAAINADWVNSRGLTEEEVHAASKAGLIAEDQRWWWLESWQEGEREVEADFKAGRVEVFNSPEEFRKALNTL
ncbi:MAG: AbrB/MazE/SpoVT family DNA-binding domain-containing protein [Patescibacteria group bacterium]|nr:AbrB/MazE/SpoVT family DNA-binding domain-containing protein [Patescibacteria group bacterium]